MWYVSRAFLTVGKAHDQGPQQRLLQGIRCLRHGENVGRCHCYARGGIDDREQPGQGVLGRSQDLRPLQNQLTTTHRDRRARQFACIQGQCGKIVWSKCPMVR